MRVREIAGSEYAGMRAPNLQETISPTQFAALSIGSSGAFKAQGEITEFDPPRVLAYTWRGNWHEHPEQPSTARWELSPTRTGTRVKVTHSGLANEPTVRKDYAGGWPGVLEKLRKHCE